MALHASNRIAKLPLAISSMSVGRALHHSLEEKITAISNAGYDGIEVFYEDLKLRAKHDSKGSTFEESLIETTKLFRSLCDAANLIVTCIQPFKNYDGLLSDKRHAEKIKKLELWLKLAEILRCDLIIVPSMFHKDSIIATGDEAKLVSDMQELADIGAAEKVPVRFAYEVMAWGAHISCWQDLWRIVKKADRENLGICLDSFQILASMWGDPTRTTGKKPNADNILIRDSKQFIAQVPLEKCFYVQIADAALLSPPLSPSHPWHDPAQEPTMTWSRNARLFPYEESLGAYMPVAEILKTWLVDVGYNGFVGIEVFNKSLFDPNKEIVTEHSQRGIASWKKTARKVQELLEKEEKEVTGLTRSLSPSML